MTSFAAIITNKLEEEPQFRMQPARTEREVL